jgi:hypothetical protein
MMSTRLPPTKLGRSPMGQSSNLKSTAPQSEVDSHVSGGFKFYRRANNRE